MKGQKVTGNELVLDVIVSRELNWEGKEYIYDVSRYDHSTHNHKIIKLDVTTLCITLPSADDMIRREVESLRRKQKEILLEAEEKTNVLKDRLACLLQLKAPVEEELGYNEDPDFVGTPNVAEAEGEEYERI